ncbi:cytochrome P460 family protein [Methylomonas paludis]|uniref:Cytochrome P460 family protein n=2 Tax=Methylomonas paludis TaxID=1173101 RepID=A0A975MR93_9GAMM|nr:cytochrome P460 family protein [Methylomonas paludis]
MQKTYLAGLIVLSTFLSPALVNAETASHPEQALHGSYKDWRVLGVSHRLDKKYVRAILGNDIAINAARSGKTQPWPDGTVIAKLSWKEQTHPRWPQAVIPGEFAGAEAIIKDSKKYPETGGWAFGHWEGGNLVINDKEKTATCFACHTIMKDHDYVFTEPALQ